MFSAMTAVILMNFPLFAAPDLSIDAVADPSPANVGSELKYTVTIANDGNESATDGLATINLDSSLQIKTTTASDGLITRSNNVVYLQFAELASSNRITLEILAVPSIAGEMVFVGSVFGTKSESIPSNNSFTFQTAAEGIPNTAPSISLISPADNQVVDALADLQMKAEATDAEGALQKIELFVNEVKVSESASSPFNFSLPQLRPGTFTLTVVATDSLGAHSAAQAHITSRQSSTNSFVAPRFNAGHFSASFSGDYLNDYAIQASSPGRPWVEIGRLTRTNFSGEFSDPDAALFPARLYRALLLEP